MTYTIKLNDGKYTVINDLGRLRALRYGQPWRDLVGDGLFLAMAHRIEELEVAVKSVLNGTLIGQGIRNDDGMVNFGIDSVHRVAEWERRLRNVLEQKP
jgi:hypothetical protein